MMAIKVVKKVSIKIDGNVWFPADNINFLCQQVDNKVICKAVLPDGDIKLQLYGGLHEYDNRIYLVPWRARHILVYDIKTNRQIILKNSTLEAWQGENYKYSVSLCRGTNLYLFGRAIPYVVKVDMATNKITVLNDIDDYIIKKLTEIKTNMLFTLDYAESENCIWIPIMGEKLILQLNPATDTMRLYKLPMPCCTICNAEERKTFWIYSVKCDSIAKWNYEKGIINVVSSIGLHTVVKEAFIECKGDVIRCKSLIESICVDIKTGQRMIEKLPIPNVEVINCDECDENLLYIYFKCNEAEVLDEENPVPLGLFTKFVSKDQRAQKKVTESFGNKIYELMKGNM